MKRAINVSFLLFYLAGSISSDTLYASVMFSNRFTQPGSGQAVTLRFYARPKAAPERWPDSGEVSLLSAPGETVYTCASSAPLSGLTAANETCSDTLHGGKSCFLFRQAQASLLYHCNQPLTKDHFPVTSDSFVLARLAGGDQAGEDHDADHDSLVAEPFINGSSWLFPPAKPASRKIRFGGGGGMDDTPFQFPPKPYYPFTEHLSGLIIHVQPALIRLFSAFWQETATDDYSRLEVSVRLAGERSTPFIIHLSKAQWLGFQTSFLTTSRGWNELLSWLHGRFSDKGIFLDYLSRLLDLGSALEERDEQLTEIIGKQLQQLLEQPDYEFSLSLELEVLNQNTGILEAGNGGGEKRQQTSDGGSSGETSTSTTTTATTGSTSASAGSQSSGSQTVGNSGSGDGDDGDGEKPPTNKKIKLDPYSGDSEEESPESQTAPHAIKHLILQGKLSTVKAYLNAYYPGKDFRTVQENTKLVLSRFFEDEEDDQFPESMEHEHKESDGKISWKAWLNPKYLDQDYDFLFATDAMTRLGFDDNHEEARKWLNARGYHPGFFEYLKGLDEQPYLYPAFINMAVNDEYQQVQRKRYLVKQNTIAVNSHGTEKMIHALLSHDEQVLFLASGRCLSMAFREGEDWRLSETPVYKGTATLPKLRQDDRCLIFREERRFNIHIVTLDGHHILHQSVVRHPEGKELPSYDFGLFNSVISANREKIVVWSAPEPSAAASAHATADPNWTPVTTISTSNSLTAVSPDGKTVATAATGQCCLYTFQDPEHYSTEKLPLSGSRPEDISFSADNQNLFVLTYMEKLIIFIKSDTCWRESTTLPVNYRYHGVDRCHGIFHSSDAQHLTLPLDSLPCGKIDFFVRDGTQWKPDSSYSDSHGFPTACIFSPCNRFAAIKSNHDEDKSPIFRKVIIRGYKILVNKDEVEHDFTLSNCRHQPEDYLWRGHQEIMDYHSACFSPDRVHLALISEDGWVSIMRMNWSTLAWDEVMDYDTGAALSEDKVDMFFSRSGDQLYLKSKDSLFILSLTGQYPEDTGLPFTIIKKIKDIQKKIKIKDIQKSI